MTTDSNKNYREQSIRRMGQRLKRPLLANGILRSTLVKLGIDKEIARYRFVLYWKEIVGEEIAKRTRPDSLKYGRLTIRVSDSIWAQELSFQKEVILKRLRRYLDEGTIVRDVVFQVGL